MRKIKAIETRYKGYRFRSRLEARWAVFFETLGCQWEYEPEGFDLKGLYYLPDFKVTYPGGGTHWFEVKSSVGLLSRKDIEKMTLFARYVDDIYLLDGTPEYGVYINFSSYHQGTFIDVWEGYYRNKNLEPKGRRSIYDTLKIISNSTDIALEKLERETDSSISSFNENVLTKELGDAKNRYGDILYTYKDGGRIWGGEWGNQVDENWDPLLTEAITAARSARFEHGENPGRY